MKNTKNNCVKMRSILAIIALVAVIWFSTVSCGSDDDSGGGGGGISGNTIATGAEVIYEVTNLTEAKRVTNFSYVLFFDDEDDWDEVKGVSYWEWWEEAIKPLSYLLDGSPSVKVNNNRATIILGTPKSVYLENLRDAYITEILSKNTDEMEGFTISPSNAKFFSMGLGGFISSDGKYMLILDYYDGDYNDGDYYIENLVYADRDVTIKGTYNGGVDGWIHTTTYNLSLKKGWNYIISSETNYTTETNYTWTRTYTSSTTQPNGYKWIVFEMGDEW